MGRFQILFCEQKTAYEINRYWSSDVCSSDLARDGESPAVRAGLVAAETASGGQPALYCCAALLGAAAREAETGRASWRERV